MNHLIYDFDIYRNPSSNIPEDSLHGNNEGKLLIVLNRTDYVPKNIDLLSKILQAIGFELKEDACILTLDNKEQIDIDQMKMKSMESVIIFGVHPKDIGYSFKPKMYAPFQIQQKQFILAHSLENINNNQNLKKQLWQALKMGYKQG